MRRRRSSSPKAPAPAGGRRSLHPATRRTAGFSLIEVLLVLALAALLVGITVPLTADVLYETRTAMAARYLEGRVMDARMHAVRRSTRVALRFERWEDDYRFGMYVDGNANGVRTMDIEAGVDAAIGRVELLRDRFEGVAFGIGPGIPEIDADEGPRGEPDGVRVGASRILTLGPDGTSSSGTLYLRGRRGQYAVRVLGATGRTRVLRFETGTRRWSPR